MAENLSRFHGHVEVKDSSVSPAQERPDSTPAKGLRTAPVVDAPVSSLHKELTPSIGVAVSLKTNPGSKTPSSDTVQGWGPFRRSGEADYLGGSIAGMAHIRHTCLSEKGVWQLSAELASSRNSFSAP